MATESTEKAAGAFSGIRRGGYSVKEFAAMFGISEWNLRLAIKEKQIATLHFGKRVIIPASEFKRLSGVDFGAS